VYGDLEHGELFASLEGDVRDLDDGRVLTIAQFSREGLVRWELHRDEAGTPHAHHWQPEPWPGLELTRIVRPEAGSSLTLVNNAAGHPDADAAFELMTHTHGEAPAFRFAGALDELIRSVIKQDPLTQFYELVVLRRSLSGQLRLTGVQLFSPGARRGDRQSFTVRCAPADEGGTVLAVVAIESVDQVRLVSLESVSLTPGLYNLTAVLHRPGLVRFEGLPTKPREEHRSWLEVIAGVPGRFTLVHPAHLICAVEVSGSRQLVEDRIQRAAALIGHVAAEAEDRLKVSVLSYGAHGVRRVYPDEPATFLTQAEDDLAALAALNRMRERGGVEDGYPRAAQLECALALVAAQLNGDDGQNGRPVLVTIGSRPAFPPRMDPSEILPCPAHTDWRRCLRQLGDRHPGIAFGAISERAPAEDIWVQLAHDAFARLDVFDVQMFANQLGLASEVCYIPFPLIGPELTDEEGS
jgi:hypothetical protein